MRFPAKSQLAVSAQQLAASQVGKARGQIKQMGKLRHSKRLMQRLSAERGLGESSEGHASILACLWPVSLATKPRLLWGGAWGPMQLGAGHGGASPPRSPPEPARQVALTQPS